MEGCNIAGKQDQPLTGSCVEPPVVLMHIAQQYCELNSATWSSLELQRNDLQLLQEPHTSGLGPVNVVLKLPAPEKMGSFPWCYDRALGTSQGTRSVSDVFWCGCVNHCQSAMEGSLLFLKLVLLSATGVAKAVSGTECCFFLSGPLYQAPKAASGCLGCCFRHWRLIHATFQLPEQVSAAEGCIPLLLLL